MSTAVHTARRFYVEIAGIPQAVFTEVSGLQVDMQVHEYQEGGNNGFVHRLPGPVKVGNLTLKRGLTTSNEFFKWCMEVATRSVERRHVSVLMYDLRGVAVARWDFLNAYPVKWVGPQFTATSQATAIETLELAHSGVELGQTNQQEADNSASRSTLRAA
jgi:phage tail-like protein